MLIDAGVLDQGRQECRNVDLERVLFVDEQPQDGRGTLRRARRGVREPVPKLGQLADVGHLRGFVGLVVDRLVDSAKDVDPRRTEAVALVCPLVPVLFSLMLVGMDTRTSLVSVVAFALLKCRRQLRVIATAHEADEARRQAAEIIVEHIERCRFEVRELPRSEGHKTPGG